MKKNAYRRYIYQIRDLDTNLFAVYNGFLKGWSKTVGSIFSSRATAEKNIKRHKLFYLGKNLEIVKIYLLEIEQIKYESKPSQTY